RMIAASLGKMPTTSARRLTSLLSCSSGLVLCNLLRCGRGADVQPDDLAPAVGVGGHGDYCRNRDDAAALALLQVSRVEPQIGPLAGQRPVEKGMHALVDLPRLRGGRLLHSLETCDLLIPDSPIACTRSSTRRVDT